MFLPVRAALVAGIVCSIPWSRACGQASDASIVGRVRDRAGAPVAGAAVQAVNTSTGGRWTMRTNDAGRFAFVQLPLGGPYTVTARLLGARPAQRAGYELRLGRQVVVDIELDRVAASLAEVRVEARNDARRAATAGANYRVGAEAIAAVPTVDRNFTDLAALAPTTGPQLSMLGQRWTSTDVRIDGAQSRNMLRAGEFGAGPFTLSMDAVREFEVSTAVYDVTQGRQGGGTIRAATRAGTNEWLGSAFTYYKSSALSATTDFEARSRTQREFDAVQSGFSIGGPLVRDRAHLFLAFDRRDASEPLFSGLVQTPADESASGVARDSLARLIGILGAKYGLDTSRAQLGRLDRRPVANALFARLDFALDAHNRLTVTGNVTSWRSPLSGGVDQPITLLEARADYRSTEQQALATLRTTRESGLQNELSIGASTSRRILAPGSDLPRGFVRIQSRLADGTTGDTRVQFGGNRLAPDDSRELELQLIDHAYVQRGNVLFTVGTDNSLTRLSTYIAEAQGGLFEFNSLALLDSLRAARYSRTVPLADARPGTRQSVLELGAFAQAEWRPTARVTSTVGLRWDGSAFLTAPPRNALVEHVLNERTDRAPRDWTLVEPRAQIVWDADGAGNDVIRVGGGRFGAQPIYYLQHDLLLNDGSRIADITLTGRNVPTPDFTGYRARPETVPGVPAGAAAPAPYVNLVDRGFTMPRVWKGSASWRHRLARAITVTGTIVGSRTEGNYTFVDRNLRADPAFALANEAGRPVFVPPASIDAGGRTLNGNALAHPELGRVLSLTNLGRATGRALILDMTAERSEGGHIAASYTFNRAEDNTTFGCCLARTATTFTAVPGDPRDLSGSWGPSDTDFRHKLVLAAALPPLRDVHIGLRYVGMSGRPVSAVVNGDINGDEASSNDLAFVFDPDDPATGPAVAAAMRRVLDNPRNAFAPYLRENLGRIATRNGAYAPWTERIDLRATKRIATARGQWLEVGVDVFNVANLLNPAWGAEYQLPAGISNQNPVLQRLPLLNVTGFDQVTKQYRYTVNENFGVLQKSGAPYQVQLSARYGL